DQRDLVGARGIILIPGQREQRALLSKSRRAENRRYLLPQPRITGLDRAVVHVAAHVWRDERVVGRRRRRLKIGCKLTVGNDVALAAARIVTDVVEVNERIVLLGIWIAVADEACRRHRLLVGLPALPCGFKPVGD